MILNQFILISYLSPTNIYPEKLDGIKFNFCIFIIKDFLPIFKILKLKNNNNKLKSK